MRSALLVMNDDEDDYPLETDLLFTIDAVNSALRITARGWDFIADRLESPTQAFEVAQILSARVVHEPDEDYVVGADGITLVDKLDGRPMHSHRYLDGLHEAIESREGIEGSARRQSGRPDNDPRAHVQLHDDSRTDRNRDRSRRRILAGLRRDHGQSSLDLPPTTY